MSHEALSGHTCKSSFFLHYLQAVASKTSRRRLAQFRMGSHMLGVETGRWQRLPRAERLCQRCSCGAVDDEAHMIWGVQLSYVSCLCFGF